MESDVTTPLAEGKHYPTLLQGFGIIGIAILIQGGLSVPFKVLMQYDQSLGTLILYTVGFLLTILFAWKVGNLNSLSFGSIVPNLLPWVIAVTLGIRLLIEPVLISLPYYEQFQEMMMKAIGDNMFLSFLTVAIAASILEEILFRGIILAGFLKNYSPWKAIFWSAVLFGLVHMNPYQFLLAVLIGMVMGWIYWKTGSLWLCILIHFVNNSFGFILGWFLGLDIKEMTSTRELMTDDNQYMMLLGVAAVAVALSLYMLHRNLKGSNLPIDTECQS